MLRYSKKAWNMFSIHQRAYRLRERKSGWRISAKQGPIKTLTSILEVKTFCDCSSFITVEKLATGSIDLALSWEL